MIQAELTELDNLSRRLAHCGGEVTDLQRALTALINTTTWTGGAATRFRQAWDSQFNPALRDLATALSGASGEVERRRHLIDQAANH